MNNSCNTLFSETTIMADLLQRNYMLLDVFPCFGLGIGCEDRTVKQVCDNKGVPVRLFLLVCNVYTFDDYIPDRQTIEQVEISDLVNFFSASNKEYNEVRRPRIFGRTLELVERCPDPFREAMVEFFNTYERFLSSYLDYEANVYFPYVMALANGEIGNDVPTPTGNMYKDEVRVALSDLLNLIVRYIPDDSVATLREYRDVLINLAAHDNFAQRHIILKNILTLKIERIRHNSV